MQYAANMSELTVLFFVNPATFELIKLRDNGMLAANTPPRHRPVILPARLSSLSFQIRSIPTIETAVLKIIMRIRVLGTSEADPEVRRRKTSWAPPIGIWMRRASRWGKPKPVIMIAEKLVSPPLQKLTQRVYSTKSHIWRSFIAIQTWFHLNFPWSITPVLFFKVLWTAMALSFGLRKIALAGESGRARNRTIPYAEVTAPRIRNKSCHWAIDVVWIFPMPYAINPY